MERKTEEQIRCEEIAKRCQDIQLECKDHVRKMVGTCHFGNSVFALFPFGLEEAALDHLYQNGHLDEEVSEACRAAFKKRRERLMMEIALIGGFLSPGYSVQDLERVVSGIERFYSEQTLPLVALTYERHDQKHRFLTAPSHGNQARLLTVISRIKPLRQPA